MAALEGPDDDRRGFFEKFWREFGFKENGILQILVHLFFPSVFVLFFIQTGTRRTKRFELRDTKMLQKVDLALLNTFCGGH